MPAEKSVPVDTVDLAGDDSIRFSAIISVFLSVLLTLRSACRAPSCSWGVLALRHQLQVLRRSPPARLRLARADRLLCAVVRGLERVARGCGSPKRDRSRCALIFRCRRNRILRVPVLDVHRHPRVLAGLAKSTRRSSFENLALRSEQRARKGQTPVACAEFRRKRMEIGQIFREVLRRGPPVATGVVSNEIATPKQFERKEMWLLRLDSNQQPSG